ncbi:MAG: NAD-dependent epimerase/dehydratase family protein [Sedimentibacter sp.]
MKKVLITGGAGSMGKELSILLAQKGYEIYAFDIPNADYSGFDDFGITGIKGDITDFNSVKEAISDKDIIVHLAALLPPVSERSWDKTFAVNVKGTRNLVDAIVANGNKTRLIFSSTVASYGDTTKLEPPIRTSTPQNPNSNYSKSKVEAEKYIFDSNISYTILRVSGVVLAALMDPPAWPFISEQRVEFVYRGDVVTALISAVEREESANKVMIIAGGKTWQMRGYEFVERFLEVLDIPVEDAEYPDSSTYSDWYDTEESQRILDYQKTDFPKFLEIFQNAVEDAINGLI